MAENSKIEWTDATWNPIKARRDLTRVTPPNSSLMPVMTGWHCEHVSPGCEHCYAESMNKRLGTGLAFKPGHRSDLEIFLDEKTLLAPLRWKKPRRIFVNSMSDTFAKFVKDEWIDGMFAVMALCPQHVFQVLTKRAARMLEYLGEETRLDAQVRWIRNAIEIAKARLIELKDGKFPLPNVWLGISAEDQQRADERIPLLLDTPAAVRFVSLEPLLGPIVLRQDQQEGFTIDWLRGCHGTEPPIPSLDWVIVGGESGPHARPMHPDWVRGLRDQCKAVGVPFFFKQVGEWAWCGPHNRDTIIDATGIVLKPNQRLIDDPRAGRLLVTRVGKKRAGRLLDGIEWNQMPGYFPDMTAVYQEGETEAK
jgi:protein gp37